MSDASQNAKRHGHVCNGVETPTYRSWKAMKRRCGNAKFKEYARVSYCEDWRIFENFLRDMGERPDGTTLDRIDNAVGYQKDNCRWADKHTQCQNRRFVVLTKDAAKEVLRLKGSGVSAKEVAAQFQCSDCNVRDVWAGRAWGNLQ